LYFNPVYPTYQHINQCPTVQEISSHAPLHDRGGMDGQVLVSPKPIKTPTKDPVNPPPIAVSVAPPPASNFQRKRTMLRQLSEQWLANHPYWLTHGFPIGHACFAAWRALSGIEGLHAVAVIDQKWGFGVSGRIEPLQGQT
jgi:hypothetical protein